MTNCEAARCEGCGHVVTRDGIHIHNGTAACDAPRMITPGQVADLHEHLRTCHGQVRIAAEEATDPSFLLALHRVVQDQNPDEAGPACAPYTHRADPSRANPVPAHEYEPGYDAEAELQGWMNELRTARRQA